ncbi:hypothetical protein TNCV_2615931 [Trichonephila clavipes]|nr:hypothetical protein TNCV_2615931 [Trichonephila clavipes]
MYYMYKIHPFVFLCYLWKELIDYSTERPRLKRTRSYAIFKSRGFVHPSPQSRVESLSELDEIGNLIEEVVDLARQINLQVNSDDVQELLDFHNRKLTIDELIEMHEQEQDIEELESLDPVQSEDRMTVGNLTESLSLIEK